MYLNKEQFNFLKYLSSKEKIEYSSLSENEIKISNFLEEEKLISVNRESFPKINQDGQVRYAKGKTLSLLRFPNRENLTLLKENMNLKSYY